MSLFFIILAIFYFSKAIAMPDDIEINIGRQTDSRIKARYGVYENQQIQKYVEHVGLKIVTVCERQDLVYHFVILNSNRIDAKASPGGYVYVTKGMLTQIESEAELAAILAQNIAHIARRHGIYQIEKNMNFVRGTIEAGVSVSKEIRMVSAKSDAIMRGINTAYNYTEYGYGKKFETEADLKATEYLLLAGYDTEAMIKLFDMFQLQEKNDLKRIKNFLKRYHKTTKRIDMVRAMRANLKASDPNKYISAAGNFYKERYSKEVLNVL